MAEIQCHICGKDATCLGRYDTMTADAYAGNDCCGHGCEDGHCELLEDLPGHVTAISNALADCAEAYGTLRANLSAALGMEGADEELVAAVRAASVLVRNAVHNARKPGPRWAAVRDALAVGSTRATELCRRFDLDPYEEFPHPEDEDPACESGLYDCGPATASDSEGVPLCERCFHELADEALDAFRAKGGGG